MDSFIINFTEDYYIVPFLSQITKDYDNCKYYVSGFTAKTFDDEVSTSIDFTIAEDQLLFVTALVFDSSLIDNILKSGGLSIDVEFDINNIPQQLINLLKYLKKNITKDSYLNAYGSLKTQKTFEKDYNKAVTKHFENIGKFIVNVLYTKSQRHVSVLMSYYKIYTLAYKYRNNIFLNDELDIFGWAEDGEDQLLKLRGPLMTDENGNVTEFLDLNRLVDINNPDQPLSEDLKRKLLMRIILYGAIIYSMKLNDINDPDSKFTDIIVPENLQNNQVDIDNYYNLLFQGNGIGFITRMIKLNQYSTP